MFILVLLCACGGVNVLLYSLHVQNKEHLTEDFIVLRNSDNSKASKSAGKICTKFKIDSFFCFET